MINTVKILGSGYLVNGVRSVPNDPDNREYHAVQDWIAAGNTPDPEFSPAEELANVKQSKIEELKREGLRRIQLVLPGISNWDVLELERERWLSITPASRNPTAAYQSVIDIYQAGRTAVITINAMADTVTVNAYDVNTAPAWP